MMGFQCVNCIHLFDDLKCLAFPNGIPREILTGMVDHIKEYEGDGGIRFESVLKEEVKLNYKCPKGTIDDSNRCGDTDDQRSLDAPRSSVVVERIHRDNPGGDWLKGEHEYAKSKYEKTGKINAGSVTASIDGRMPTSMLAKLPGVNDEHKNPNILNDYKAKPIRDSIKNEGVKEAIMIYVGFNGEAKIAEGNHRVHLADEFGLKDVPVDIRYFAGGELVDGDFKLSKFENETDKKYSDMEKEILNYDKSESSMDEDLNVINKPTKKQEDHIDKMLRDRKLQKLKEKYKVNEVYVEPKEFKNNAQGRCPGKMPKRFV